MGVSRFTSEHRGALIERTAAGVSLRDACHALGLREQTVKGWLTRGRREEAGEYAEFAAAIDRARDEVQSRPEAMDSLELARVVSQQARKGSVTAMRLRWEMLQREESEDGEGVKDDDDSLAEVDELARRRTA